MATVEPAAPTTVCIYMRPLKAVGRLNPAWARPAMPALFFGEELRHSPKAGKAPRPARALWVYSHVYGGPMPRTKILAGWLFPVARCPDARLKSGLQDIARRYTGSHLCVPSLQELVALQSALRRAHPCLDMDHSFHAGAAEGFLPLDDPPLFPYLPDWPCLSSRSGTGAVRTTRPPFRNLDQSKKMLIESGIVEAAQGEEWGVSTESVSDAEMRRYMIDGYRSLGRPRTALIFSNRAP